MYPRANLMGLLALLGSPGSPFYWNRLRLCCCTLTLCLKSHIFCNCKCAYKYKSSIHIYHFIMSKYNSIEWFQLDFCKVMMMLSSK